ncbi:MAG: hypothetical protein LBD21_07920 [Tannerellaceae bacterium]|jgi:hypothetical protein|nr:hypothetical protein [Tannerellaceae bacterium]
MADYKDEELRIINKEKELAAKRSLFREEFLSLIEEKVDFRQTIIRSHFNDYFIKVLTENTRCSVYLNEILLRSAIKSYYYDIHKYKDFSGSTWANGHKQAAYTIKWLVRFRPIQIKETTEYVSEEISEINLKFALFCGFEFLDKAVKDLILHNKQEVDLYNKRKSPEEEEKRSFFDSLLYDLRYRQLSGKKLALVFEALQLAAK